MTAAVSSSPPRCSVLQLSSTFISSNGSVPDAFSTIVSLTLLDLASTGLTSVPSWLHTIGLHSLAIGNNSVNSTALWQKVPTSVLSLSLDADPLQPIESDLTTLTSLVFLSLYSPTLTSVPAALSGLTYVACCFLRLRVSWQLSLHARRAVWVVCSWQGQGDSVQCDFERQCHCCRHGAAASVSQSRTSDPRRRQLWVIPAPRQSIEVSR